MYASTDHHAVSSDGTLIGCRVAGHGDSMVLVHGAASDWRQWSRVIPLLARCFTVVAMDRRGHGRSGPQRTGHTLADDAADIVAVAASVGAPVHLVGHSSGARYALLAAPDIEGLASLVLFEPPAPEEISDEVLARLDRLAGRQDREGVLRAFFVDAVGMADEEFAALRARPIWPVMVDNALTLPAELRAARSYLVDGDRLARVTVPTVLLVGENSGPEMCRVADELADGLPNATIVTLEHEGHGAMCSSPELFSEVITRFVAERGATLRSIPRRPRA